MNCGECLFNAVKLVELGEDGKCPECGTQYDPPKTTSEAKTARPEPATNRGA